MKNVKPGRDWKRFKFGPISYEEDRKYIVKHFSKGHLWALAWSPDWQQSFNIKAWGTKGYK